MIYVSARIKLSPLSLVDENGGRVKAGDSVPPPGWRERHPRLVGTGVWMMGGGGARAVLATVENVLGQ